MAKLHQIIAKIKTIRQDFKKCQETVYHALQKHDNFKGIAKTYSPIDDDGFVYPPEAKALISDVKPLLNQIKEGSKETLNILLESDRANQKALGTVIIDGEVILDNVPVSTLIALEKEILNDFRSILSKIPCLDPSKTWHYDSNTGLYASDPEYRTKTKKITKPVVLYEATDKHPAQVKEVSEDIVEGTWKIIDYSTCLPFAEAKAYLDRCQKLLVAVQEARAIANETTVEKTDEMDKMLDYLFGNG